MSTFSNTRPTDFSRDLRVVTCFIEHQNHLLLLQRSTTPFKWAIPGGKVEKDESDFAALQRELFEELGVNIDENCPIRHLHEVSVRNQVADYQLILYKWELNKRPEIVLNPREHIEYRWVPISDFGTQDLIDGQYEAFKIAYIQSYCDL